MNMQQAQQLAEQAGTLCERLAAAACDAQARRDWREAGRVLTIRRMAVRRWGRRLDKWAVAVYGEVHL